MKIQRISERPAKISSKAGENPPEVGEAPARGHEELRGLHRHRLASGEARDAGRSTTRGTGNHHLRLGFCSLQDRQPMLQVGDKIIASGERPVQIQASKLNSTFLHAEGSCKSPETGVHVAADGTFLSAMCDPQMGGTPDLAAARWAAI